MRNKQAFTRNRLRFALAVAVVAAFSPSGASNPERQKQIVPYFLTWHVSVRGQGHGVFESVEWAAVHGGEMTGSAILRFLLMGKIADPTKEARETELLLGQDIRYLSLTVSRVYQKWTKDAFYAGRPLGICNILYTQDIANPSAHSGLYAPQSISGVRSRADGVVEMESPFHELQSLTFIIHTHTDISGGGICAAYGEPGSRDSSETSTLGADPFGLGEQSPGEEMWGQSIPGKIESVNLRDDSSFLLHKRTSIVRNAPGLGGGGKMTEEVEWTAYARRLGKCAERDGPIPEGDRIIHNEQVEVVADKTPLQGYESSPVVDATPSVGSNDGSINVTVSVTCDRVPIHNAEVEVTVEPRENSGYHLHPNPRPRGTLNGKELTEQQKSITVKTGADGKAKVKFESPTMGVLKTKYGSYGRGIAGVYEVKAKSKRFPESTGSIAILVKSIPRYPDGSRKQVSMMTEGATLELCCATMAHPSGFYGTPGTTSAFAKLASDFYQDQQNHDKQLQKCKRNPWDVHVASINDLALPNGGLFDLDENWDPDPDGHYTHNKGEGGDFNRFEKGQSNWGTRTDVDAECKESTVRIQDWLLHELLELGRSYGTWDCHDLRLTPDCLEGGPAPGAIEIPPITGAFPHRLHLHVED